MYVGITQLGSSSIFLHHFRKGPAGMTENRHLFVCKNKGQVHQRQLDTRINPIRERINTIFQNLNPELGSLDKQFSGMLRCHD